MNVPSWLNDIYAQVNRRVEPGQTPREADERAKIEGAWENGPMAMNAWPDPSEVK